MFFAADDGVLSDGLFKLSRADVFDLLDARILSNKPSSVRKDVLHDKVRNW